MPSEPELMQRSQHQILADLRNAAALLYPEESSARVIVDDAGLDARQIAFSSRAESNWHNIWLTAIRQNQTDALVAVLAERYPGNPPLQAAIANYQRFRAAGGQFNAQALLADSAPDDDAPAPGDSPYQGMAYYDVADADRFFGREALTAELVDHLRQQPLLAVVGASGSGKSSLVRAGVMPALQGKMPLVDGKQPPAGSARWAYHLITPTARPLESLAASLTRSSESVTATSTLIDDLGRDARSLHLYARRLVSGEQRLVLLVDQFEELFTLCKNETEQGAFVDNLLYAAQPDHDPKNSVVTLVLTLRADFYHHCARFPALRMALENQQKYIGAMTRDELRRAIEEPAKAGRWEFQAGLVEQLLQDVGQEPGALPLLSHALLETWQRRRGRTLTLAGYHAAGGVQGAIAKTADDVYSRFTDEQKTIARIIFLRLTELGEGVQDTRRRVRPAELKLTQANPDAVQQVLKTLADARLVTTDDDEIQVAHEALIRNWQTLREWLDDDREGNRTQRRLTEAANQWVEFGKEPTLLYRSVLLQQAQGWLQSTIDPPNQIEMAFLQASQREAEAEAKRAADLAAEREANRQRELENQRQLAAEQIRRAHILRNAVVVATLLFLLAATAAGVSYYLNGELSKTNGTLRSTLAETQRLSRIARARQLAAQSDAAVGTNYPLSLLLATEALTNTWSSTNPLFIGGVQSALHARLEGQPGGIPLFDNEGAVRSVAFSSDGKWLASGSEDGTVRVWQVEARATGPVVLRGHEARVTSVAFSSDGKWLASGSRDGKLRVWAVGGWADEPRVLRGPEDIVLSVAFSGDSKWLGSSAGRTLQVWQVGVWAAEPVVLPLFPFYEDYEDIVLSVAFSSDGKWLASGSVNGIVQAWSVEVSETGSAGLSGGHGHMADISSVAFSSDGQWFASGNADKTIEVWSAGARWDPQVFLLGHEADVSSVAFSGDGKWLASGSADKTVRVWSVGAWLAEPVVLRGHEAAVTSVAFSGNGKWLASGSVDGTVRVWTIPTDIMSQKACRLAGRNFTLSEWLTYVGGLDAYRPTCPAVAIPDDVLFAIVRDAEQQIHRGQVVSATQRLDQLNGWLQINGQFETPGGKDVAAFVEGVWATATAEAMITPTLAPTITPPATGTPVASAPVATPG
jgi:WD40 repeat protein/energy-coupling factor transporter ATP-binding protein EcfA2